MRVIVKMIVMVIIRVKIVYIGVLMKLVNITSVMLNLIDSTRLKLIELMKIIKIMMEKIKARTRVIKVIKIIVKIMIRTIIRVSVIEMIKMIVMIMKVIMKVIMKIECIGVIVRLVSRRGGSLNWT